MYDYKKAEKHIGKYLEEHGHTLLKYNYKKLPYGEIDIISLKNQTLYATEVKARTTALEGEDYFRLFSRTKQNKILRTLEIYRKETGQSGRNLILLAGIVYWDRGMAIRKEEVFLWPNA